MSTQRQHLTQQLRDNESALFTVFGKIPDSLANSVRVSSTWTIRDELAHIVSWIEEIYKESEFIISSPGATIPWEIATESSATGYDKWNQARIKEFSGLTVRDLLDRYRDANLNLIRLIERLQDEQLGWTIGIPWEGERTILQLISIHTEHEHKHLTRSRNALARP